MVLQAVGIYAVEQAISKTVETAKELVNESKRLGLGVEQLQLLRQAAKDSGTDMEKLAGVFEKIDVARQKALSVTGEGMQERRVFAALGINSNQLRTMGASQMLMGPMADLMRNRNPEQYAAAFKEVLGKGFGEVLPILKTNFGELSESMKKLGAIMDTETAVKLSHLKDEFELVSQVIISQLGPALVKLVEILYQGILKLGSKVAGVSAGVGAGTSGMKLSQWPGLLKDMFVGGVTSLIGRVTGLITDEKSKQMLKGLAAAHGYNVSEAVEATDEATKPWTMKLDQFNATLDKWRKEAHDLDNQKQADFSRSTVPAKLDR